MILITKSFQKLGLACFLVAAVTGKAYPSLDDDLSQLACDSNEIKAHFSGVFENEMPFARLNLNTAGDPDNFSPSVYLNDVGLNPTPDRSLDPILGEKHDVSTDSDILSLDFFQCYDKNSNPESVTAGAGFIYFYQPDGNVIQQGAKGVGAIGDKLISPLGEEYYQFTLIGDSLFKASDMFNYMDVSFSEIITKAGIPVSEDQRYKKPNSGGTIQQGIYWVSVAGTLKRIIPLMSRLYCKNSTIVGDDILLTGNSTTCYIPEGVEVRKFRSDEILNQENSGTADSFSITSGNDYLVRDGNLEQIVTGHRQGCASLCAW